MSLRWAQSTLDTFSQVSFGLLTRVRDHSKMRLDNSKMMLENTMMLDLERHIEGKLKSIYSVNSMGKVHLWTHLSSNMKTDLGLMTYFGNILFHTLEQHD